MRPVAEPGKIPPNASGRRNIKKSRPGNLAVVFRGVPARAVGLRGLVFCASIAASVARFSRPTGPTVGQGSAIWIGPYRRYTRRMATHFLAIGRAGFPFWPI